MAIIQTLGSMLESARNDNSNDGCAAFVLCLVDCLLQCLQGMLEYFNKFAYIYGESCDMNVFVRYDRCFVVAVNVNLIHPYQLPSHTHTQLECTATAIWKQERMSWHYSTPRDGI